MESKCRNKVENIKVLFKHRKKEATLSSQTYNHVKVNTIINWILNQKSKKEKLYVSDSTIIVIKHNFVVYVVWFSMKLSMQCVIRKTNECWIKWLLVINDQSKHEIYVDIRKCRIMI